MAPEDQAAVDFDLGLATPEDAPAAARLYRESFGDRQADILGADATEALLREWMDLLRATWPESFFVARTREQALAGMLVLTTPDRRPVRALLQPRRLARLGALALRSGLRASPRALPLAWRRLRAAPASALEQRFARDAHVAVVAVASSARGTGIGRALLERAHAFARGRYPGVWLFVDADNPAALRLYAQAGYGEVGRERDRVALRCDLGSS